MTDEREYQERLLYCRCCERIRWHYRYVRGAIGRWCCSVCAGGIDGR